MTAKLVIANDCPLELPGLACRVYFDGGSGAVAIVDVPDTKDPFEVLRLAAARIYNRAPNTTPATVQPGVTEAARKPANTKAQRPAQPRDTAPDLLNTPTSTAPPLEPRQQHQLPPLAGDTPSRVGGVRDTSLAAHRHLKWSGKLTAQEKQVIATLVNSKWPDMTRQEIAEAAELDIPAVCGRVHKLLHGEFAVLEELPSRKCRKTGESAHPVRLIAEPAVLSLVGKP